MLHNDGKNDCQYWLITVKDHETRPLSKTKCLEI